MITVTATPEIRNIEFMNGSVMFIYLSNDRTFLVPLDQFPLIKKLNREQRADFEIIDGVHLSFLAIDDVYSLSQLIGFESLE